jgi:23S rRNA pseudouridine1911/1915/1917 synthase
MNKDQEEFRIIGETPDLMVVSKPAGLLVHPRSPVLHALFGTDSETCLPMKSPTPGRYSSSMELDRETSGLVFVAKNSIAAREAAIAMQEGKIQNPIWLVATTREVFTIEAPIIRQGEVEPGRIHLKRIVHPTGAFARTHFRVLKNFENDSGILHSSRPNLSQAERTRSECMPLMRAMRW